MSGLNLGEDPFRRSLDAPAGVESDLPSDVLGHIHAEKIVRIDLVRDLRKVKSRFELEAIRRALSPT